MLFWALAGLLAIGLYAGQLHDPDLIWGYMTKDLLFPGAVGLMLVGILAANMSSLDAGSVSYSALFIRNLYRPFRPNLTDGHYLFVGRIVIAITLLGGIASALMIDNLLELFKYIISIPAIFGASIWLGFIWRRLTKWAVIIQVAICIIIYALIPNLFQVLDSVRLNPIFLIETNSRIVTITAEAKQTDIAAGIAGHLDRSIRKEHVIEPVGILFDKVARSDPKDSASARIGLGRFHAEIWILSLLGIDFANFSKAQLVATRFLFDALFPFVLLFMISFLTNPVSGRLLDRFFAKLHTPVQPTPEAEKAALEAAYANPRMYESDKIVPGSQWEIMKPAWMDIIGFGGSWVLVGFVIFLLWLMVSIH